MKNITYLAILCCYLFTTGFTIHLYSSNAITFQLNKGRLGDHLLAYCKSRWIAYKNNWDFYVRPFPHFQELSLSKNEAIFSKNIEKNFSKIIPINHNYNINLSTNSVLYITNIYLNYDKWTSLGSLGQRNNWKYYLHYQDLLKSFKSDQKFLTILRSNIKSKKSISIPPAILKHPTIALHVRQGSQGDPPLSSVQLYNSRDFSSLEFINSKEIQLNEIQLNEHITIQNSRLFYREARYADKLWPQKFPPLQYYVDQLNFLQKKANTPLQVYLFTDHVKPENLAFLIRKAANNPKLIFKWRDKSATPLEDLFAMAHCTYLIRPHSHLSLIAEIIGHHKATISPRNGIWLGNILFINQVNVNEYN